MLNYLALVEAEGFATGIDTSMFDWCPPGECFTLYSSNVSNVETGVMSQSFRNEHNTIDDAEGGVPIWALQVLITVLGVLLVIGVVYLGVRLCSATTSGTDDDSDSSSKAAPLAGKSK